MSKLRRQHQLRERRAAAESPCAYSLYAVRKLYRLERRAAAEGVAAYLLYLFVESDALQRSIVFKDIVAYPADVPGNGNVCRIPFIGDENAVLYFKVRAVLLYCLYFFSDILVLSFVPSHRLIDDEGRTAVRAYPGVL